MNTSELITDRHLARKAIIYIRPSSPHQVLTHQESRRLQYALRQRALHLGWRPDDIEIIDSDTGLTASGAQHREGFKEIAAQVTLGQVGIIFSTEVQRLSRNCSDWYPLLDICGYKGCLIADRDGIYDPGSINGRLILGLKGQLSEMELHTIRARLTAGLLNKAQRGELALKLPVGLVRDENGVVTKDPNREVQQRIVLVFETFLQRKSASQVLRYLCKHHLKLPRITNQGDVVWKEPTLAAIVTILKNPAYSGTFVYGRTRAIRQGGSPTDISYKILSMDEWMICLHDKYPAYIGWDTFVKIQAMLRDNHAEYKLFATRGIVRPGAALLQGIAYCGECGHKMQVQYKSGKRYLCNQLRQQYGTALCQLIPAEPIEARVVAAFFEALSPIELNVYERALAAQKQLDEKRQQAQAQQLERLRYQAALAERQFNRVDPDNRLVAAELERRWEVALRELHQAEVAATQPASNAETTLDLNEDLKKAFQHIGQELPKIWHQGVLLPQHKKALLRCLIDKVVLHRSAQEQVQTRIVWKGGATTTFSIPIAVGSWRQLSSAKEMENLVLEMVDRGESDIAIAQALTVRGFRSAREKQLTPSTVRTIRLAHQRFRRRNPVPPRRIPGYLTAPQIAEILGKKPHWLYDHIRKGCIQVKRDLETGLYLFPDKPSTLALFKKYQSGKINKLRF